MPNGDSQASFACSIFIAALPCVAAAHTLHYAASRQGRSATPGVTQPAWPFFAAPPAAILDGQRRTIAVAELANTDILWSEPRDLRWANMSWQINDRAKPSVSSHHPGGAQVVFIDAHSQFLSNQTDPVARRALFTIAGGEPVDPDDVPFR